MKYLVHRCAKTPKAWTYSVLNGARVVCRHPHPSHLDAIVDEVHATRRAARGSLRTAPVLIGTRAR